MCGFQIIISFIISGVDPTKDIQKRRAGSVG